MTPDAVCSVKLLVTQSILHQLQLPQNFLPLTSQALAVFSDQSPSTNTALKKTTTYVLCAAQTLNCPAAIPAQVIPGMYDVMINLSVM